MKCIKKGDVIKRVTEDESKKAVKTGWSYIPKTAWKGRNKEEDELPAVVVEEDEVTVPKPRYKKGNKK